MRRSREGTAEDPRSLLSVHSASCDIRLDKADLCDGLRKIKVIRGFLDFTFITEDSTANTHPSTTQSG